LVEKVGPQVSLCPPGQILGISNIQSSRKTPFDNVLGVIDGIAVQQEQTLAMDVPCVADY